MRRSGNIVTYTADELREKVARGETLTDWARLAAMTDEEIEANADSDEDSAGEWTPVEDPFVRYAAWFLRGFDSGVIEWFADRDPNYPQRMNDVLKDYIAHQSL